VFYETFKDPANMDFILTPELSFLIGLAVFWMILYILGYVFHLDEHGLDTKPGYFMYKSKALNSFLDRLAHKRHNLWLVLSNVGLAFSIGLMVFSIYFLTNNLLRFIFPTIGQVSPVYPVIPVLTIRFYWLPYFFLAVTIIILSHELAHGIIARLEGIPVLSTGILAFLLFFGAFVEPDEKEFEKAPVLSRLRMLAAGSSTNLVTALIVFLLMTSLFAAPAGILIYDVTADSPLARSGIDVQRWDVIQAINDTSVQTYSQYSDYMRDVRPNVTLTLTVLHANQRRNITIVTDPHPNNSSRGRIGFELGLIPVYSPNRLGLDQYIGVNIYFSLFWVYLLGVSVAMFNMLPAFPFDGERVLYYPLSSVVKKRKRELRWALNGLFWGLFALNMTLTFLIYGLPSI
jgi:membrane-associated protease RseP (regulator of RpoE activity)